MIFSYALDSKAWQPVFECIVMKGYAVVPTYAAGRRKPHESKAILINVKNLILYESVIGRIILEEQLLAVEGLRQKKDRKSNS